MPPWATVLVSLGSALIVAVVSLVGTFMVTSRARKEEHRKVRAEAYARLIGALPPPGDVSSANKWVLDPDIRSATGEIMLIGSSNVKLRLGDITRLFRAYFEGSEPIDEMRDEVRKAFGELVAAMHNDVKVD
jgi:hypothetical protein